MKKILVLLLSLMFLLTGCSLGGGDTPTKPDPVRPDPVGPVRPDPVNPGKDPGIGSETSDTNLTIGTIEDNITIAETNLTVAGNSITTGTDSGDITQEIAYDSSKKLITITPAAEANGKHEYVFSGEFEGNILVKAGDEDEVKITLDGFTIKSASDSPIKCVGGAELQISLKNGTQNYVYDKRSAKTVDNDEQGNGAITAECDLKLSGKGSLTLVADYNNGIHTKDDLTIKPEVNDGSIVKIKALNNCLKGNDSVEIESGNLALISATGNGVVTENTDLSSKGKQRGSITISGGHLDIYSAKDGIDAAYDVVINTLEIGKEPVMNIYTNKFSTYSKLQSVASDSSAKGIKADNEIKISAGALFIKANDDAIHANYGDVFESGTSGLGNITISGGDFEIYSADDAIHADNTLTIAGGNINVAKSVEGLEANFIVFNGGYTKVYSVDDGVNASKKINKTPSITVNGGVLDVTVYGNDVDGIDSNGTFTQTGGIVITKGANGRMSTGLDCDGAAKVNGGTFISFGTTEARITAGTKVTNYSLSGTYQTGTYTITVPNNDPLDTSTKYQYSQIVVYSDNTTHITVVPFR